jgi:hypothetical protein
MQILLTGGPGLDAQFDKPGLANAARQVASSRWRIENEAPPVEDERPAPRPTIAAVIRREPAPAVVPQPDFEPAPLRKVPKARAYAVRPDPHQEFREPARSSRRVYWVLALGILFAFAAGFVTNAFWPFAPKSATELLKGDGQSALTANLPSMPPRPIPSPMEPQVQPEPDPAPSAPASQIPAAAEPPPAPVTRPAPQAAPPAAALPPEWNQPVERPRPSSTRNAAPAAPPPAERPVVAAPTPLTPQPLPQQAQMPPPPAAQQPAKAAAPADVCREGSGAPKPPQNSLAGIAEGFMTDLRSLGRCLNSLAR